MSKRKNQHFVPRFYLRNFSYLLNGKQIGVYNTKNAFCFKTAPIKSQGARDFFYGTDGIIENRLSEIEGRLAAIVKKILAASAAQLTADEHYDLILFIILTISRNPSKIVGLREMMIKMRENLLKEEPETDIDTVLPLLTHEDFVRLSLVNCEQLVKGIMDLEYLVIENFTSTPFITSDNPVVKYNQYLEAKRYSQGKTGLASIGLEIFVPISKNRMILLYDRNCYDVKMSTERFLKVKRDEEVDSLNLLQFVNCINTIYFSDNTEEAYLRDMHRWSMEFDKGNVPYSKLGYLAENKAQIIHGNEKANLAINGTSDCEIGLKISGIKFKESAKYRTIHKGSVQPRPGSFAYESLERNDGNV